MNRVRSSAAACLALVVVAISGCGLLAVGCTSDLRFGVSVRVQSAGGGDISTSRITVSVTDGSYQDEFTFEEGYTGTPSFGLAPERVGRYHLEVTAEGYEPWEIGPIFVFDDECHVKTVPVTAELVPIGR